MTHASVFSGIGGPEVAATMLGWENLFHCEINPFGRKVLDYWYPNAESYEDITTTDFSKWRGRIDVLTGGFPCQPFSYAGQRRGAEDDRYLWPYMFSCIDQIRPTWVVCENVAGITTMVEQGEVVEVERQASLFDEGDVVRRYKLRETFTLERICDDLERHGYSVQPMLIPACAVGAPHRRDRVFIVGHRMATDTTDAGLQHGNQSGSQSGEAGTIQGKGRDTIGNVHAPSDGNRRIATDTTCRGEGTPRTSAGVEGCRSDTHQQQSEWSTTTEWNHRFYAVLQHATNPELSRLEGEDTARGESSDKWLHVWRAITRCCGQNNEGQIIADTCHAGLQEARPEQPTAGHRGFGVRAGEWVERFGRGEEIGSRWQDFPSVSPVHRGNDGLPFDVDDLTISFAKWRTEALKAYGNAIVVQVMYEIFRAIQITEEEWNNGKR